MHDESLATDASPDEDLALEERLEPSEAQALRSAKADVLVELYRRKSDAPSMIVTGPDIQAAIAERGSKLGVGNPANFLKDIIRRRNANDLWPSELKELRITARQRFGQKRVLEFIPYADGQDVPFPDSFEPTAETPTYDVQSISLPSAARRLGREDETWLTQIVVNLRIVEAQLAFRSPLARRLRDISHLQIGMKTQPEIDATFIVTAQPEGTRNANDEEHIFVTCEVKKKDERLLEDQLRFQIHQGFKSTDRLRHPAVEAVKPFAIRVMARESERGLERLIYVVEFESISRSDYEASWKPQGTSRKTGAPSDDTPVYGIPLTKASDAFFRLIPAVKGVS